MTWRMSVLERVRSLVGRAVRSLARLAGQDVVSRNFYSPIPQVETLSDETFTVPSSLPGIRFDYDEQLARLEALQPYLREYQAPPNPMYGPGESDVLYATLRARRPRRVVELGSGYSSLIIAEACRRNSAEGHATHYEAYDPFPRDFVASGIPGLNVFRRTPAQEIPLETFSALQERDVLFVDTTHTVKVGSDVNYVILDVLPRLRRGVVVHLHDIWLPYAYPKAFLEQRVFWQEQYLLQAFLVFNPHFEVLYGLSALARDRRAEFEARVRALPPDYVPSAFWIERV